ncbi:CPBP family intramembrane glutamic endopeptidase [Sphingobacterium thalpophilum]|uniref:CPBP family intramembrane glutamic endopeptidase n=1 Tax=Sphingobacterium thalpophilum TaxID=259 RepID=UPI002D7A28C9|nr:CPBP family intramembrane glutamic endopeptidase [Sphingobacterium thalpophilum]
MKQKIELLILGFLQSSIILILFFLLVGSEITSNRVTLLEQLNIFLICLCTALFEEIVFRYYLINGLLRFFNKKNSMMISSLLFAACHLANSHVTFMAFVSHFLGGIIYANAYMRLKSIYYAVGLHFGWNYLQWQFSRPMSGTLKDGLYSLILPANDYWFGGSYGIEGGVASLLLRFILFSIVLFTVYKYKGNPLMK